MMQLFLPSTPGASAAEQECFEMDGAASSGINQMLFI